MKKKNLILLKKIKIEEYKIADKMSAQFIIWQDKDLIRLITKFKTGLEIDSLKDLNSYEIVDRFVEEAIEEEAKTIDKDNQLFPYCRFSYAV